MSYSLRYRASFMRSVKELDHGIQRRLLDEIDQLVNAPRSGKRLSSRELAGKWSWRFGDYRIIYEIYEDDKIIDLVLVSHRRNVYDIIQRLFSFLLSL